MATIKLGDKGRCKITGFEGICTARTEWISGCTRVVLQPPVDKDGKIPDAQSFDEPMVEIVQTAIQPAVTEKGGPRPDPVRSADPKR